MTGGARLAGLASVARQRLGGAGADREKGRGRSDEAAKAEAPNACAVARTVALVIRPPGALDPFVASAAQLADSALTIHDTLPAMQIFASPVANGLD